MQERNKRFAYFQLESSKIKVTSAQCGGRVRIAASRRPHIMSALMGRHHCLLEFH